ncbi:phage portal protein [Parabacteroides sp. Marseille-P3160]|uniref:phage portal protein n=1 Tax=Parabacteroides sp. Marseille-P3160 TaxID=1917887 RepID=UPI0009BB2CBD|nr:phage portal protein [Parabacteroides sp. Marseille-P3160]
MNILSRMADRVRGIVRRKMVQWSLTLPYWSRIIPYSMNKALKISAVYRCIDVISDSVAQLPLILYKVDPKGYKTPYRQHSTYNLLRLEPCQDMSRFTFFKALMTSVLIKGNGYALIERRPDGDADQIILLNPDCVDITWIKDEQGVERKRYRVTGISQLVEPHDMIHVLNFTYDGIRGVSTLEHAAYSMELAYYSESNASQFFKNGGAIRGYLSTEAAKVSPTQRDEIRDSWKEGLDSENGVQSKIPVLGSSVKYNPLQVSPVESQLLESRQYNVIDICRFFGVSPVKAFDLSKSNYNTVEATQLAFLTDTLAPILEKIENEFTIKLYTHAEQSQIELKFNTAAILRADKTAQANYYRFLISSGVYTPNEVRRELDEEPLPFGDHAFIQSNMATMEEVATRKKKEATQK